MTLSQNNSGFGQAPSSNTGSVTTLTTDEPQRTFPQILPFEIKPKTDADFSTKLDWLQGVAITSRSEFDFMIGEISSICKDVFANDDKPKFSGRTFAHSRRSPKGGMIAWNYLENGAVDWWLCLPAQMLSSAPVFLQRRLLKFLLNMNFKTTRIDLAIDDFTKSLLKQDFVDACDNDLHHGFQTYGEFWRKTRAKPKGWTFYMGSFGSDKLLRLYDKSVESNGELDCYRLEAQYRDTTCNSIVTWLVMAESDKKYLQVIGNIVVNSLDFYSGKEGKEDFERCVWWQEFRDKLDASDIKVVSGRAKTSIEKTVDWIEKSVERSLATVEEYVLALGQDFTEWLYARLESGREKIRDPHRALVKSALLQLGVNDSVSYDDILNGYF